MKAGKCAVRVQMTLATAPILWGDVCQFPGVRSLTGSLSRLPTTPP